MVDDLRQCLAAALRAIISLGDGRRGSRPNAHRCLLLWRRPPPGSPLTAPAEAPLTAVRSPETSCALVQTQRWSGECWQAPRDGEDGISSHRAPHQGLLNTLVCNQAECVYGTADGRTTVNVVPSPKSESTQIRPLWASTIDLTIESPSPVPLTSPGTLLARKNLSKR
jgi:hypothetical protein